MLEFVRGLRKGVGKVLLQSILLCYDCTILSNVSVKNEPSLKLHQSCGFIEVGIYEKDDFGGEKNYKSYLLSTR